MKSIVVDASVVAAAFFAEQHAVAARALLAGQDTLYVPDFIFVEVASVVWKRHRQRQINAAEAISAI